MRLCKFAGTTPSWLDLHRIFEHHAAPPLSMGKWRRNAQEDQSKGWQYWPGSWSASPNRQAPWRDQKKANSRIPAYDALKANVDKNQPGGRGSGDAVGDDMLIQELQRAVNSARRAETKVKKITQEKAERKQQWQSWEQELKRTYAKERARHNNALNRLDTDMKEALQAQEQARAFVRQVSSGNNEAMDVENLDGEDVDFAEVFASDPWEELAQDAVLQRALAAAAEHSQSQARGSGGALATPTRTTRVSPMTPQLGGSTSTVRLVPPPVQQQGSRLIPLIPFPPPLQNQQLAMQASPSAATAAVLDPYVSATSAGKEVGQGLTTLVGGNASPSIPKTPKQRQPVKDGAKPSGPIHLGKSFPALQEKIEEKRAALTQQFILDDDTLAIYWSWGHSARQFTAMMLMDRLVMLAGCTVSAEL